MTNIRKEKKNDTLQLFSLWLKNAFLGLCVCIFYFFCKGRKVISSGVNILIVVLFHKETLNTSYPHCLILTRPLGKDDRWHRKTSGGSKQRLTKTQNTIFPLFPTRNVRYVPNSQISEIFEQIFVLQTMIGVVGVWGGGAVSPGSLVRRLIWNLCDWAWPDHSRHHVDTVNQRVGSKTPAEDEKKKTRA